MTMFHCEIVKISNIIKHPDADSLSIAHVMGDYPVIFRTDQFKEGDLAAYICVDSVVPDTEIFAFLQGKRRIKARRLRGIYSEGLLVEAPQGFQEGDSIIEHFGITKYDPEDEASVAANFKGGLQDKTPEWFANSRLGKYDIEPFRKLSSVFEDGEEVVITEKINGCNALFRFYEDRMWCRSRLYFRKEAENDLWWNIARKYDMLEKLKNHSQYGFYGEIYGQVKKFPYDADYTKQGLSPKFRVFDVYDFEKSCFLEYEEMEKVCQEVGLDLCPVIFQGKYFAADKEKFYQMAEQDTVLFAEGKVPGIREGFVIRPLKMRTVKTGRLVLKYVSERYHLKNG